uniref:Uncharacterized protein n=1 Tax=Anguilla anguilla TaxID=7936 RepID=A0A0E9QDB0_ANGAN
MILFFHCICIVRIRKPDNDYRLITSWPESLSPCAS